jgi:hypothetical protein
MGIPNKFNRLGSDKLPAGYKRIEYYYVDPSLPENAEVAANSIYFDTAINTVSKDISMYADFVPYSNDDLVEEWQSFLSLWQNEQWGIRISATSKKYSAVEPYWDLCYALGTQGANYATEFTYGNRYKIMHTYAQTTVNGVVTPQCKGGSENNTTAATTKLRAGAPRTTNAKYYELKAWIGTNLVLHAVPVQNPDSIPGLYDLVGKKFYTAYNIT